MGKESLQKERWRYKELLCLGNVGRFANSLANVTQGSDQAGLWRKNEVGCV